MKDQQKYISFIVTFALLLFWLSQKVDSILGIPWLSKIISSGTVALVIYFFYLLWEKVLWKMKFISRFLAFIIGFNVYPVIEGKWKIDYISTFVTESGNQTQRTGEVYIKQDYSEVFLLDGKFGASSNFESICTTLQRKTNKRWFLLYLYRNNPQNTKLAGSPSGGSHEGFCYLEIKNENLMEGYYSNDETRKTRGRVTFTKIA